MPMPSGDTWVAIPHALTNDPQLTDAGCRLAAYLACRPGDGQVVDPAAIPEAITPARRREAVLEELCVLGYITDGRLTLEGGGAK